MDTIVVACAQQRLRLYESLDDYRRDCVRFLRMAQSKGASLVVFPEMSGVMAAVPHLPGVRASLLRQADLGGRSGVSVWKRLKARIAGSTAELLRVDFRAELIRHLAEQGSVLRREVERLFAELARSYGMYLIVGAGYLPGTEGGQQAVALAFSPQGEMLGEFARVSLLPHEEDWVSPGEGWSVLQAPLGRIGVLMGGDVLYPETARLLAYHGAEILVVLAATSDPALAARIRATALARAQENQLFVITSFLVGNDPLRGETAQLTGRSAIMAPVELTERYTGIMVEMGTAAAEGLITAELNFYALRELWQEAMLPTRRGRPLMLAGQVLASDYTLGRSIDEAWEDVEAERERTLLLPEPAGPPAMPVAELPVVGVDETPRATAVEVTSKAAEDLFAEADSEGEENPAGEMTAAQEDAWPTDEENAETTSTAEAEADTAGDPSEGEQIIEVPPPETLSGGGEDAPSEGEAA